METRRLNPEPTAAPPGYHVWEVPDKPVQVQLDLDVVDRMLLDVMRGFGAVPRRGAEVGGLLLGTSEYTDRLVVKVEDFEPIPCEYRSGPSYVLSENDGARFAAALDRWRAAPDRRIYVVGFYRSHTRESLFLSGEDMELVNRHFADPSQIILLVKPYATRVSVGGFFFQENGEIHGESSFQEFPFRRRELQATAIPNDKPVRPPVPPRAFEGGGSAAPPRTADGDNQPEPPSFGGLAGAAAVPQPTRTGRSRAPRNGPPDLTSPMPFGGAAKAPPVPAADAAEQSKGSGHSYWLPLSAAFLILGVVLGFAAALLIRKPDKTYVADPYALNLSVTRDGADLNLSWDTLVPAIRRSLRGTLVITDGDHVTPRQLSPAELEVGRAVYHRQSNTVQFRLEVFTAENSSIAEKIELHLGGSEPNADPQGAPASSAGAQKDTATPVAAGPAPAPAKERRRRSARK